MCVYPETEEWGFGGGAGEPLAVPDHRQQCGAGANPPLHVISLSLCLSPHRHTVTTV